LPFFLLLTLVMKTALCWLGTVIFLGVAMPIHSRPQSPSTIKAGQLGVPQERNISSAPNKYVVHSAEAGHVESILVWANTDVVKGQPLLRLSIAMRTPEQRQYQLTLQQAEKNYQAQPSPEHAQALTQARSRVASAHQFVREGFVVAPVAGRLVRNLVETGQYLPRAGSVAIIEVPAVAKP
jgi:biotin carboxyl carrier protein